MQKRIAMERQRRVVLVDDDDSLRRAFARTIRLAGYDVISFQSVNALLDSGVWFADACLVLDVNLPGVSGIDFRRSLADSGRNPPTIFITALDRDETDEVLTAFAPVAVLYKPFGNDELLHAIDRACAETRAPDNSE